jgi:peroxiredoxin
MTQVKQQPLQPQLDAITEQTRKLVQPERLEPAERSIAEAESQPWAMVQPGQVLPAFVLPDASNRLVKSDDLLALGPLVIKFFRGRWDPYCTTELEAWRDCYPQVRGLGALFIAISPQAVRQNDFLVSQHSLPFPVLRDERCAYAATLGLARQVPEYLQRYYRSILVNVPFLNGEDSWMLPMPATLVIERHTGVVLYVEGHADFRVRPEPQRAIEVIASL